MMKLSLVAFALIALTSVGCASVASNDDVASQVGEVNASAPITLGNWVAHPKIVAIRDLVNVIDTSDFESESKELCKDAGHGEFERTKLTDESGVIRELVLSYGSEDSARIESYYYDANAKLRFVFTTRNDVHGNSSEMRTYFDETGARIWDVYRSAHSEMLDADIQAAPYEAVAEEDRPVIAPALFNPATRYDGPERCD